MVEILWILIAVFAIAFIALREYDLRKNKIVINDSHDYIPPKVVKVDPDTMTEFRNTLEKSVTVYCILGVDAHISNRQTVNLNFNVELDSSDLRMMKDEIYNDVMTNLPRHIFEYMSYYMGREFLIHVVMFDIATILPRIYNERIAEMRASMGYTDDEPWDEINDDEK